MVDKAQAVEIKLTVTAETAIPGATDSTVAVPPVPPRRSPGHRGADMRDTMAELAARAQEISQEAGSKIGGAMKDVINAAAGLTGFAVESARDLVQYMVRRGQMTAEEADKLIREAEEAARTRRPAGPESPAPASAAPSRPAPPASRPVPTSSAPSLTLADAIRNLSSESPRVAPKKAEPVAAPKLAAKVAPKTAVRVPVKPTPKAAARPATKPPTKPAPKVAKPASKSAAKPAAKGASKPTAKSGTKKPAPKKR